MVIFLSCSLKGLYCRENRDSETPKNAHSRGLTSVEGENFPMPTPVKGGGTRDNFTSTALAQAVTEMSCDRNTLSLRLRILYL